MTQKRIHDYRGPRSSEDLNRKLVGIIPPGVYAGFTVETNGTINPGVLMTADGVRIEEDEAIILSVPAGDSVHPRKDLIVCQHQYEQAIPVPEAQYTIIQGTPVADPDYPDLPEHSVLLARATMPQGAIEYSEVIQVGPPIGSVHELAGVGRTDETVMGNQMAIEDLAGDDRTTETVKGNSNAIVNHLDNSISSHPAKSISIEDTSEHLAATKVETALKEILDAFTRGHYREKDTPRGKHKYPLQQEVPGGNYRLLWEVAGNGNATFRMYYRPDHNSLFVTINASTDGAIWTKDENGKNAAALHINSSTLPTTSNNEIAMLCRVDDADWAMTEWTILFAAKMDDNRVYVPSLALHTGTYLGSMSDSPSWTSGDGVPTASEPKGSIYSDTTNGDAYVSTDGAGTWAKMN